MFSTYSALTPLIVTFGTGLGYFWYWAMVTFGTGLWLPFVLALPEEISAL